VPGQVKTRLIPALGADGAAALHRRLTEQQLERLCTDAAGPVELWVTPDTEHPFVEGLARRWPIDRYPQQGNDLGSRMQYAAGQALKRADSVILVGTDCPRLDAAYIRAAAERLRFDNAVLGPALDGGYVLLGLRRVHRLLFAEIPWGTSEVAALTRQRLTRLGWRWSELEALADIDRPEDLAELSFREAAPDTLGLGRESARVVPGRSGPDCATSRPSAGGRRSGRDGGPESPSTGS
jgi:rSAM/selenodomain-associated transferase 1